jgi:hypothetical protein
LSKLGPIWLYTRKKKIFKKEEELKLKGIKKVYIALAAIIATIKIK